MRDGIFTRLAQRRLFSRLHAFSFSLFSIISGKLQHVCRARCLFDAVGQIYSQRGIVDNGDVNFVYLRALRFSGLVIQEPRSNSRLTSNNINMHEKMSAKASHAWRRTWSIPVIVYTCEYVGR